MSTLDREQFARWLDWERRRMTICIAAECRDKTAGETSLILCTDWLTSSDLGSSDFMMKSRYLGKNWFCLTSGNQSEISAICPALKISFKQSKVVDESNIVALVQQALRNRRLEKINELVYSRLSLSYDRFLEIGKTALPDEIFVNLMADISTIQLEADFIVAGFSPDGIVHIVETDRAGRVFVREDFAVIGSGRHLAQSMLLLREKIAPQPLKQALYYVYEAKKISERVTSVGKTTCIMVQKNDTQGLSFVSDECIESSLDPIFKKSSFKWVGSKIDYDLAFD